MKNLNTTLIWLIIGFVIGYIIVLIFDSANIGVLIGEIGGAFAMYLALKLQTRKNKCILPVVSKTVCEHKRKFYSHSDQDYCPDCDKYTDEF